MKKIDVSFAAKNNRIAVTNAVSIKFSKHP